MPDRPPRPGATAYVGLAAFFAVVLALRIRGIADHFWLLGDQTRDWAIALGRFRDLPLVGPATHVDGYTIGPAFYWILWGIRVTVGPWFENLPHAGGIGQAILQSAADALLLVAVWRRTQSVLVALTVMTLVVTAGYDLCLAPLVWNPVVGSTLAKVALALVLLDWHRGSARRAGVVAAIAWMAVHAYTGAIFVAVSVMAALVLEPAARGDWNASRRAAIAVVAAVVLLQLPYVAYQVQHRFDAPAMGAVTDSVGRILSGQERPLWAESAAGFVRAVDFLQVRPWTTATPLAAWVLPVCGALLAAACWRDVTLLATTLLPQALAVAGFAFFLGALDNYYYLSLMPSAVLTAVLGLLAIVPRRLAPAARVALCAAALALTPARVRFGATMHRMPEYGPIVAASRTLARRGQPLREVEASFALPPTADAEFVYRVLGGPLDPASEWIAVIGETGSITYRRAAGR